MRFSLRLLVVAALVAAGCSDSGSSSGEAPGNLSISPNVGSSGVDVPVVISGTGFFVKAPGTSGGTLDTRHRAWLGSTELTNVAWQSPTTLNATVPATIQEGTYDLTVENALGARGTAKGAYTALPPADFAASLTAERPTVNGGQQFTVALVLKNNTQEDITGISLGALSITSPDGASASIRSGPTPAAPRSLASGASVTLTWTLQAGSGVGHLAITVSATGTHNGGSITATPPSPTQVTVQRAAALTASWTSPPALQTAGQPVTMTLVLANADGSASASVTGVTPTTSPTANASCTAPSPAATAQNPVLIAGGTSATFTWTCTAQTAAAYTFGATVAASDANTGAAITTSVTGVTVTFTPRPVVRVTVNGNGTGTVSSSPAGISSCSSAGGSACSAQFDPGTQVTLTATPGTGATTTWSGCSSASGNTCTISSVSGSGATVTATFTVPTADMRATVAADFPTTANLGATVTGNVSCTNAGPNAAVNATCAVSGVSGATTNCNPATPVASLASGQTISCSVSFTAPASDATLTVTAHSATLDETTTNDVATHPISVTRADMVASAGTVPTSANAGAQVTGTVTCTNNGPSAAANATCAVTVAGTPVACSGSPATILLSGQAISCPVSFTAPATGSVNVGVTAGSTTGDPTSSNNSVTRAVAIVDQADMSAAVSGIPSASAQPAGGTAVTGSATCANAGPSAATNPTCTVSGVPSGGSVDCGTPLASLPAGQSITCSINYTQPFFGVVSVSVVAGSATADPVAGNNTAASPP